MSTVSMVHWNIAGAKVTPKGRSVLWYNQQWAFIVTNSWDDTSNWSFKYACDKSNFEKTLPLETAANSSLILDRRYTPFFATLLIVILQSPQSLTLISYLIIGTTGVAHDENFTGTMMPFAWSLSSSLETFSQSESGRVRALKN